MIDIPFRAEPTTPAGDARLTYQGPRDGRVWLTVRGHPARTGGHSIAITGIARSGERLAVRVRTDAPAPDAIVTQVLTSPAQTVSVEAAEVLGVHEIVVLDQHDAELARLSA